MLAGGSLGYGPCDSSGSAMVLHWFRLQVGRHGRLGCCWLLRGRVGVGDEWKLRAGPGRAVRCARASALGIGGGRPGAGRGASGGGFGALRAPQGAIVGYVAERGGCVAGDTSHGRLGGGWAGRPFGAMCSNGGWAQRPAAYWLLRSLVSFS